MSWLSILRRAVELGRDDAVALAASAHALAHLTRDLDGSIALLDRALVLDRNFAAAWYLGGFLRIWRGEPDDALERIAHAMRLSPLGPDMHRMQAAGPAGSTAPHRRRRRNDRPRPATVPPR